MTRSFIISYHSDFCPFEDSVPLVLTSDEEVLEESPNPHVVWLLLELQTATVFQVCLELLWKHPHRFRN